MRRNRLVEVGDYHGVEETLVEKEPVGRGGGYHGVEEPMVTKELAWLVEEVDTMVLMVRNWHG